jgi:ParB family transcriptional regulator, chromosome partitioning protein
MSKPVPRLGKGLSAIIGPRTASGFVPTAAAHDLADRTLVKEIPIESIQPNPQQPRTHFDESALQSLADSIRANGLLQPVIVRPSADGRYELVAGERRWRAARLAGLARIPATVRSLSDQDSLAIALLENLQREDLGPLERAAGYRNYMETFAVSADQLADRLGESRANVANYLRLLKLQDEIQQMLSNGQLGMGQARALASVDDTQRQLALARLVARRNLSVRQVEDLARRAPAPQAETAPPSGVRQHLGEVEQAFTRALGVRVALIPGRKKNAGRIVIQYDTLDEFDRIAERLGARALLE